MFTYRLRDDLQTVLRVDHPDIMEFIEAKVHTESLQNFNISVSVTDRFMEALRRDDIYELVSPRTNATVGTRKAKDVFAAIVNAAWHTGDPGLIFVDTVNRFNPTPHLGLLEATNPCGEVPLLAHESCNLGSINLSHMLGGGNGPAIDWQKLRDTTRKAVRFLDDVIEVNKYPFPDVEHMTRGNRKIGLGVMGFAEMLIRSNISYDSREALQTAERIAEVISLTAREASQSLAEERGVFPNWRGSLYEQQGVRIRNATRTAIAPTGTISIIAGTSPSIEPLFALAYRRAHVLEGQTLVELNDLFQDYAEERHLDATHLAEQIVAKGRLAEVEDAPGELKQLFATALEIPVERHIQMQVAFQRHIDNSVSKTINLPQDASPGDIDRAYRRAWELGLKGITVYRYGSKTKQVLELGVEEKTYHYEHASQCDPDECRV